MKDTPEYPIAPFIVGLSRSGTTLLRVMLDAHPLLAIPTGTFFIPTLMKMCRSSPDPAATFLSCIVEHWKWPDFHLDRRVLETEIRSLVPFDLSEAFRIFYRLCASRFSKPRWGDKSAYLWDMVTVQEALPEAAFVHIIRDGRDVAFSVLRQHFGPSTIPEAATWWSSGIGRARVQAGQLRRSIQVSFEDLVNEPEQVLRRFARLLNYRSPPICCTTSDRAASAWPRWCRCMIQQPHTS